MIDRRRLLRLALLASAAGALPGCEAGIPEASEAEPPVKEETMQATIIIVGAGVAGLGAARLLHDQGRDVLVLEARDRLGGRLWTARDWPQAPVDLGASWIHGVEGNPVAELARRYHMPMVPFDYESITAYDRAGRELSDQEWDWVEGLWEDVEEEIEALREEMDQADAADLSLQAALDRLLARRRLNAREQRLVAYLLNSSIEHEYAADASDLSLYEWDQGEAFDGEDVLFPEGYDQLAEGLARGLRIQTGTLVQRIEHGERGVRLHTNRGIVQGERVLVTVPLGVLKAGHLAFEPPLPPWKQAAIDRLGMDVLNKVYLQFPHVFWDEEYSLIGFVAEQKGQWAEWLNLAKVTGQPILLGFNAGHFGRTIEGWSDAEIVADALRVLRTIYDQVPEPLAWQITRWGSDPLAYGAYSHLPPGASGDALDALARPVGERLFFAGEATSRDHQATVHGALLSGRREADRLLALDD